MFSNHILRILEILKIYIEKGNVLSVFRIAINFQMQ